jgi:hypothetical protein
MGSTARENYQRKRGRKAKLPPFVMLPKWLLDSPAYAALSLPARAALVELLHVYDGFNNGTLGMSARRLAERLGCSPDTANRALHELDDIGFVDTMKIGSFSRKRLASEYRLTFHRCDISGALPSKRFMRWFSQSDVKDNIVPEIGQSKGKERLQSDQRVYRAPKPPAHSPTTGTHIDLYHAGSGEGGAANPSSLPSSSLPSLVGQNSRKKSSEWPTDPPWSEQSASSSALAWEECYRLARANSGEIGAKLVDQSRQIGGATAEDVLDAIRASNETGKPLDFELASFLG